MAVRPKRKDPISTRPVYLPKVPARELQEVARARISTAVPGLRIYTDGAPGDPHIEKLAQLVARSEQGAAVEGELVSVLAGRPHREVRDTVAALAHGLAWARVRDSAKQEYRVLPLRGEVDGEEARFRARSLPTYSGLPTPSPSAAALYDASQVQAAFREALPHERDKGTGTYIVITDRQLGRWDAKAGRWTPLAVLPGTPVLVSVSGLEVSAEEGALVEEIHGALDRR